MNNRCRFAGFCCINYKVIPCLNEIDEKNEKSQMKTKKHHTVTRKTDTQYRAYRRPVKGPKQTSLKTTTKKAKIKNKNCEGPHASHFRTEELF